MDSGRSYTGAEIDWLATMYRVIAPDLRGYSKSHPKPRTYPKDFYRRDADDMAALIDALKLDQPHVLGFSDGGEVALAGTPQRHTLDRPSSGPPVLFLPAAARSSVSRASASSRSTSSCMN